METGVLGASPIPFQRGAFRDTQVHFDTSGKSHDKSSNARYYSLGCQGFTHTSDCERYPFQSTVPTAITLQLPQTTTQSHTELLATGLGDEDSAKRPAFLHWPQHKDYNLGKVAAFIWLRFRHEVWHGSLISSLCIHDSYGEMSPTLTFVSRGSSRPVSGPCKCRPVGAGDGGWHAGTGQGPALVLAPGRMPFLHSTPQKL